MMIALIGALILITLCIAAAVVNDIRLNRHMRAAQRERQYVRWDLSRLWEREFKRQRDIVNLEKDAQENLNYLNYIDARVTSLEDARLYDIFAQRLADGTFREEHVAPRKPRAPRTQVSTRKRRRA